MVEWLTSIPDYVWFPAAFLAMAVAFVCAVALGMTVPRPIKALIAVVLLVSALTVIGLPFVCEGHDRDNGLTYPC